MKKIFSSNKLSLVGSIAALGGALIMAPMQQAQASILGFEDLDGAGATTGTTILLDKLNTIASPQLYYAEVDLGADLTLSTGDVFTETFTLISNSSSLGGGATNFALGGDYRIELTLTGAIGSTSGTALTLGVGDVVTQGIDTKFDIGFTSGTIELFNNIGGTKIANLIFDSGGASNIELVATQFIGDVTLNALLGPGCLPACNTYLSNEVGDTIIGSEYLTVTTGSARFQGFAGSSFANETLQVNFQDNGESSTFSLVPEPTSLALLGLGLLGLGVTRKTKKTV